MEKIKKNILITGNLGYVGSVLTDFLVKQNYNIVGVDVGWFKNELIVKQKKKKFTQIYNSFSNVPNKILCKIDYVVHLAGVSNDPIGNEFKKITKKINIHETKKFIDKVSKFKTITFIFASSCSVYGFAKNKHKKEMSKTNPLTEYSKSKFVIEEYLKQKRMKSVSLRFATACGYSPRLRLDLVLNDFVANAIKNNRIDILSNGKPMRPLIDVEDMCRAIHLSVKGELNKNKISEIYNVGSNKNNFSVYQIACKVKKIFKKYLNKNIDVSVNTSIASDKRSYLVDFSKYEKISKKFYKTKSLEISIQELINCINKNKKIKKNFRESNLIRLNKLRKIL